MLGALNKHVLLVKDFDKSSSQKYTARDQTTSEEDLVKIGIDLVEIVINKEGTTYMYSAKNAGKIITKLVTVDRKQ